MSAPSKSATYSKATMSSQCARDPQCRRDPVRRGMCAAHYEQYRTRQQAYGRWESTYVESESVRLHVKELRACGLGLRRIAELAGVNRKTLQWITTGRSERGWGPSRQITRGNAEKILAVPIQRRMATGHQPVCAVGTVRRLQALVAFGYPRSHLAKRLNISPSNATRLFDTSTTHVLARTARAVEELFTELELTPGPSNRARNEGARRGWPNPLAWDEDTIDDAAAEPDRGTGQRAGFVERYQECRSIGLSDREAARRLGLRLSSLLRQLERHSLPVSPELAALAWAERRLVA